MNETEIILLDKYIATFKDYVDYLYNKNKVVDKKVAFAAMVSKKTIDILASEKYAVHNSILSIQISLLRLLCDNCLAIESANELSVDTIYDMIVNDIRVNNLMVSDEQNMSDGYLKKRVADKYPGFDKLYKFACESVHFSRQAIRSSLSHDENGRVITKVVVGNKEMNDEVIKNNQMMLTICDIIVDMLKKLCE